MNFLYFLCIYPLEVLFTFCLEKSFFVAPSFSPIILSCIVQIITIPIYTISNKIENKEKKIQKILTPELSVLKTLYHGEELFHRIEKVYKRLDYNPLLGFRGSLSLFISIPFFIAAYRVLRDNPIFMGISFFGLFNLSYPDHFLWNKINFMPILMLFFNLLAIYYSHPKKKLWSTDNSLLLLLSLFFFIYLYNSDSVLLLYWTSNNIIYTIRSYFQYKSKKLDKPFII